MATWFVYCLGPIDHWDGWHTFDELPKNPGFDSISKDDLAKDYANARTAALTLGWEGDISQGPFWTAIPNRDGDFWPVYIIAWKQPNNGTTFLASPFRLPWLGEGNFVRMVFNDPGADGRL